MVCVHTSCTLLGWPIMPISCLHGIPLLDCPSNPSSCGSSPTASEYNSSPSGAGTMLSTQESASILSGGSIGFNTTEYGGSVHVLPSTLAVLAIKLLQRELYVAISLPGELLNKKIRSSNLSRHHVGAPVILNCFSSERISRLRTVSSS